MKYLGYSLGFTQSAAIVKVQTDVGMHCSLVNPHPLETLPHYKSKQQAAVPTVVDVNGDLAATSSCLSSAECYILLKVITGLSPAQHNTKHNLPPN